MLNIYHSPESYLARQGHTTKFQSSFNQYTHTHTHTHVFKQAGQIINMGYQSTILLLIQDAYFCWFLVLRKRQTQRRLLNHFACTAKYLTIVGLLHLRLSEQAMSLFMISDILLTYGPPYGNLVTLIWRPTWLS